MATAASHGGLAAATGVACDCRPTEADVVTEAKALLRYAVVLSFQLCRFFCGLVRPLLIPGAMVDHGVNRKPSPQWRPALVLFNRNPQRHALHDLGELAGHDVSRQQGEFGSGRFVDPEHMAAKRLVKCVETKFNRNTGR